ncbi:Patched family protein [Aphelenchoides bicaudatus]|nr:Patched family protein [Aphelenchoides bicaudatus]
MTLAVLEKPVADLSGKFACLLARKPWIFILLPVLLTVALSSGIIFKLKIVRGVHWLYSPLDSAWKTEEEVFRQWASDDNRFFPGKDVLLRKGLYLIVSAKDDNSVLSPAFCNQLIGLLDTISNTSFVSNDGKVVKFDDICLRFQNQCFSNSHVRMLAQIFGHNQSTQFNVSYPLFSSTFLTEPLDLSTTLGGVQLDSSNHFISTAKVWMLFYQLGQQDEELNRYSRSYRYKLPEIIEQLELNELKVDHFHSEAFDDELVKNTKEMAPRFAITFGILIGFSVLCTFTTTRFNDQLFIDWTISKPLLGIAGVVSTLMAIISAVGLLLLLDVVFVDICSVMPFLCLSIGVDDSFLLLSAWRETSPRDSVEKRIESTLRHSGVAILITSMADSLAFLVGSISNMPSIHYFSLYSSLSIVFIYLYTVSFFSAIMVLQGRWEQKCFNSLLGCQTASAFEQKSFESISISLPSKLFNMGSRPYILQKKHTLWYQEFFAEKFSTFICRSPVQLFALLSYSVYLFVAISGLLQLKVGFDLMNIVTKGSPTEHFIQMRSKYFVDDVSQLDVAVLRPPNMGNQSQRADFLKVLHSFETTACSSGRKQTKFWFFAYQSYLTELGFGDFDNNLDVNYTEFHQQIQPFILNSAKYAYDIVEDKRGNLQYFRLTIGLAHLNNDEQILECAKAMRNICEDNRKQLDILTLFDALEFGRSI